MFPRHDNLVLTSLTPCIAPIKQQFAFHFLVVSIGFFIFKPGFGTLPLRLRCEAECLQSETWLLSLGVSKIQVRESLQNKEGRSPFDYLLVGTI